jgi:DNA mismatch repair ATPase MutS
VARFDRNHWHGQTEIAILDLVKSFFLIEVILYFSIVESIQRNAKKIEQCFLFISNLDASQSILCLRESNPLITVPKESTDMTLTFEGIWHPLIEKSVNNSLHFTESGILLTGANMSGKSTFLRTVGVNCLLAQTIYCVFASSISLPKMKIFTSIQSSDNLSDEQSFFFNESVSIKNMLLEMDKKEKKLFLIDEIFKGTNFVERMNISSVVLGSLSSSYSFVLVSTHDRELSGYLPDFNTYHFTGFDSPSGYQYDYLLRPGILEKTNAILVLRDMGYPNEIVSKVLKLSN